MPSDHAEVSLTDVKVPASTMLGEEGRGLDVAQTFVHENRIRQAASSLGAAQYCIDMSVAYAKNRKVFGKALATNQAIQFPLAELHTEAEMTRGLVRKTAWHLDREHHMNVSEWVAMSNYRANRLVCDAADRAIQVAWRHRLFAPHAVRAHLSPPPPLPHHRGLGGDPDPPRRRRAVRLLGRTEGVDRAEDGESDTACRHVSPSSLAKPGRCPKGQRGHGQRIGAGG